MHRSIFPRLHVLKSCQKLEPEGKREWGRGRRRERCNRIITEDASLKGTAAGGPIWALHQQTHTSIATTTGSQYCLIMADKDECISSQSTSCPILIQRVLNTPHALYFINVCAVPFLVSLVFAAASLSHCKGKSQNVHIYCRYVVTMWESAAVLSVFTTAANRPPLPPLPLLVWPPECGCSFPVKGRRSCSQTFITCSYIYEIAYSKKYASFLHK